jgi:hypothetical protein
MKSMRQNHAIYEAEHGILVPLLLRTREAPFFS